MIPININHKQQIMNIQSKHDITAFASQDKSRYSIQPVHFASHYVEACNGCTLIRVPFTPDPTDSPITPGTLVPSDTLKLALKTRAPQHTITHTDPTTDPYSLILTYGTSTITTKRVDAEYPNTDQVLQSAYTNPIAAEITLSGKQLKLIADYAIKHGLSTANITFTIRQPRDPVAFSIPLNNEPNNPATGVVMPVSTNK